MVNSVLRLLCVCLLRFVFVCGLLLWQRVLTGGGFWGLLNGDLFVG